ncbi:hypothetical protein GSI_02800 [Ganoderma sinense ZZ0214-1]|uniref:GH18 domain-containing protein n=1 Tax=Ganoderma sinense ZZ0214-1 TaxID=1077348 RepID=A0A2G8SMR3_9APHY|nr:hypothetical protein GSI_02800 [Ganoderma sinense ZZ0214-1]
MALSTSIRRVLFIAAIALVAVTGVEATAAMHRPGNYNQTTHQIDKRATSGKINGAYYPNCRCALSDSVFCAAVPTDIKAASLTHLFYAFANVGSDGTIKLSDTWADEEKPFPGDSTKESGTNLYGCLKQLYLIELVHRNIKTVLSVGGGSYSHAGAFNFITDSSKRSTFVKSAVQLVEDYGLDGIDIDFEFPDTTAKGSGLASLVTELRTSFDSLQKSKGDSVPYLVTAYDYIGSWTDIADDQANLYGGSRTGVLTDKAMKDYVSRGVTESKISMGLPLYGRSFESTDGLGKSYNGNSPGTSEEGVLFYRDLPLPGATVHEDTSDVASYSYDSSKREFVSYDTPNIAKLKAQYVVSKGLAGTFFWDLSTDRKGSGSLVDATAGMYGSLDQSQNNINYPSSKFDNIRNNMGKGSGSSTTSTTSHKTTTTTRKTTTTTHKSTTTTTHTTTPTSGSGKCSGVAAWNASTEYKPNQTVTYNGHLWSASDYSHNDIPGNYANIWIDKGAC